MNQLKRFLGILWMMIGPIVFILLIISALQNINSTGKGDISNPIPWIIILVIFAPIAIGLTIFGWYSWKGEYEDKKS
jgi:Zn-dependent protease with chaperone function